jgi:hypothetical protein
MQRISIKADQDENSLLSITPYIDFIENKNMAESRKKRDRRVILYSHVPPEASVLFSGEIPIWVFLCLLHLLQTESRSGCYQLQHPLRQQQTLLGKSLEWPRTPQEV